MSNWVPPPRAADKNNFEEVRIVGVPGETTGVCLNRVSPLISVLQEGPRSGLCAIAQKGNSNQMESEIAERFEPPPSGQEKQSNFGSGENDRYMLEGPRARTSELVSLFSIIRDFLRGFRVLHFVGPCVTAFGSARTKENSP